MKTIRAFYIIAILLLSSSVYSQSKSYLKAEISYLNGDYKSALEVFLKHEKRNSKGDLYYKIADCMMHLDDTLHKKYFEKAIHAYKKEYAYYKNRKLKRHNMYMINKSYYYIGAYLNCIKQSERLMRIEGFDTEVYLFYAKSNYYLGNIELALTYFNKYKEITNAELNFFIEQCN